jgi:hypothetical protein
MSDAMNKMVTAAFKEADSYEMVESMGYAWPGAERFARLLAAALAAAPTVLGLVMCGRYRLLAPDHCDTTGCRAWHVSCGHDRCEEQHNVAIVGPEIAPTPTQRTPAKTDPDMVAKALKGKKISWTVTDE